MNNMSHQHATIYKDESTESTIGSHQLPKPLNWKVLVQPHYAPEKTKGGLILSAQSKDNEEYMTAHGRILVLGDLAYKDRDSGQKWKMDTPEVGNRVTYGKYAGQKVTINGVRLLLLNDDEITSILPDSVEVTSYIAT